MSAFDDWIMDHYEKMWEEQMETLEQDMLPFGIIDDGQEAPKAPPKMWDLYGEKSE